jgi:hypothetical protein
MEKITIKDVDKEVVDFFSNLLKDEIIGDTFSSKFVGDKIPTHLVFGQYPYKNEFPYTIVQREDIIPCTEYTFNYTVTFASKTIEEANQFLEQVFSHENNVKVNFAKTTEVDSFPEELPERIYHTTLGVEKSVNRRAIRGQ